MGYALQHCPNTDHVRPSEEHWPDGEIQKEKKKEKKLEEKKKSSVSSV